MTGTVLILGASGKIGRHSQSAFKAAGLTVRLRSVPIHNPIATTAQRPAARKNGRNPSVRKGRDILQTPAGT